MEIVSAHESDFDTVRAITQTTIRKIYLMRGYKEIEYHMIETENGDYLCFDIMRREK